MKLEGKIGTSAEDTASLEVHQTISQLSQNQYWKPFPRFLYLATGCNEHLNVLIWDDPQWCMYICRHTCTHIGGHFINYLTTTLHEHSRKDRMNIAFLIQQTYEINFILSRYLHRGAHIQIMSNTTNLGTEYYCARTCLSCSLFNETLDAVSPTLSNLTIRYM